MKRSIAQIEKRQTGPPHQKDRRPGEPTKDSSNSRETKPSVATRAVITHKGQRRFGLGRIRPASPSKSTPQKEACSSSVGAERRRRLRMTRSSMTTRDLLGEVGLAATGPQAQSLRSDAKRPRESPGRTHMPHCPPLPKWPTPHGRDHGHRRERSSPCPNT